MLKNRPCNYLISTLCFVYFKFQSEFRKILISLVEVSAQLLAVRPDADEIFESIAERLETRDKIVPDKNAIKNLVEMGFSEEKVILALRLKR